MGLTFWGMAYYQADLRARAQTWSVVDATVVRTSIRTEPLARAGSRDVFCPQVESTYEIAGRTFTGGRLSFEAVRFDTEAEAAGYLINLGQRIRVRADPAEPGESVIDPGGGSVPAFSWAFGTLGLVALAVALWLAKISRRPGIIA
jgi:hypothetical protein